MKERLNINHRSLKAHSAEQSHQSQVSEFLKLLDVHRHEPCQLGDFTAEGDPLLAGRELSPLSLRTHHFPNLPLITSDVGLGDDDSDNNEMPTLHAWSLKQIFKRVGIFLAAYGPCMVFSLSCVGALKIIQ